MLKILIYILTCLFLFSIAFHYQAKFINEPIFSYYGTIVTFIAFSIALFEIFINTKTSKEIEVEKKKLLESYKKEQFLIYITECLNQLDYIIQSINVDKLEHANIYFKIYRGFIVKLEDNANKNLIDAKIKKKNLNIEAKLIQYSQSSNVLEQSTRNFLIKEILSIKEVLENLT